MLNKEQSNAIRNKLKDIGEKPKYLAKKLKITPQKLDNILNGKLESLGNEKKILEWLESD